MAEQPQVFTALWGIGIALSNAPLIPWAAVIVGFSVAGRLSGVIPTWLLALGLIAVASGLLGAFGTISVMNGGWADTSAFTAYIVTPIWLLITSVLMIRRS